MLRFYIALWAAKFFDFVYRLRGQERNDWPGLLAFKLCPDFLARVAKPNLVIAITGTNGKTTTSALINNKLVAEGYKVSFNDWGANLHAGYCLNLMRGVNIFNKCHTDAAVLEADEKTLDHTMSMIRPHYILVTNICKDSLRRNGHPEYIFDCIQSTFEHLGDGVTAILNANDPISSELAATTGAKRVFYGMEDAGIDPFTNRVRDIWVCPRCGGEIRYNYRHYRHIGEFYCSDCSFRSPDCKYYASDVDLKNRVFRITESGNTVTFPLISETIFNAFNVLSAVALLRELGFESENISEYMETQKITEIRESCVEYNGIKYYTYSTKAQNVSAASTVFEYMAKEPTMKDVILCLDEVQDRNHPTETITWIYETDYEFLNSPNISRIICGGHMYLNHKLRMLLAGIPEEKIFCFEDENLVPDYVETEGIESVYVLFETDIMSKARRWRDTIVERARALNGEEANDND